MGDHRGNPDHPPVHSMCDEPWLAKLLDRRVDANSRARTETIGNLQRTCRNISRRRLRMCHYMSTYYTRVNLPEEVVLKQDQHTPSRSADRKAQGSAFGLRPADKWSNSCYRRGSCFPKPADCHRALADHCTCREYPRKQVPSGHGSCGSRFPRLPDCHRAVADSRSCWEQVPTGHDCLLADYQHTHTDPFLHPCIRPDPAGGTVPSSDGRTPRHPR